MTQWYLRIYTRLNIEKYNQNAACKVSGGPLSRTGSRPGESVSGGLAVKAEDVAGQTLSHRPSPRLPTGPETRGGCGCCSSGGGWGTEWLGEAWVTVVATAGRAWSEA